MGTIPLVTLALAMTTLAPTGTRARAPITAFTWQGTVGGARYPNVTSCGPTECDLLQPMPWLSLPTRNASASAKALVHALRALPAGRRTIMMRTHTASFIDTDPRDFVARPALRAACTAGLITQGVPAGGPTGPLGTPSRTPWTISR